MPISIAPSRFPAATRRRLIRAALGAAFAAPVAPRRTGASAGAKLIVAQASGSGGTVWNRTPNIVANLRHIEAQPFDGMTIDVPPSWAVMGDQPFAKTLGAYDRWYEDWLKPLEGRFRRFTDNFLLAYTDDPGDPFDDGTWGITVDNFRLLARAARQVGLVDIFYDNEEYQRPWQNFPEDGYRGTDRRLEEYQDQARRRGREVMAAMLEEFPAIVLMSLHGPYVLEPKTPPEVIRNQVGAADAYELLGPFFAGGVEGRGAKARVVDGGEVYQYRSREDFRRSFDWRQRGIASLETDCAFIPPGLRAEWGKAVEIGFGVYNRSWPNRKRDPMSPRIMRRRLARALAQADGYVWSYNEGTNWLRPGGMPRAWVKAVRKARAAAGLPNR